LPSQRADQIANMNAEGVCDYFQRVDRHVALATFDFADVGAIQPRTICEDILGPPTLQPKSSDDSANFFLNLLHSPKFGRTLVKSIQVISCIRQGEPKVRPSISIFERNQ
jgi:hypothetical protein